MSVRTVSLVSKALLTVAMFAPIAPAAESYEPPRSPEDAVARVNELVVDAAADDRRAETVLLPAIASMDDPPQSLRDIMSAAMLAPGDAGWKKIERWANGAPQQAAIEALKTVTDPNDRYVFTLPYGASADASYVDAGLWVDFGKPPMLARADFQYLDGLELLAMLVHVEATRLADQGETAEALKLLTNLIRLGRMITDRTFAEELQWGFDTMSFGLQRMRDVVYTHLDDADAVELRSLIRGLGDRKLEIGRIRFPQGDREAALELIGLAITPKGGPDPTKFGPMLARLDASDRPLRLFGAAAKWQRIASFHKGWYETLDKLRGVDEDWRLRWGVSPYDVLMETPMTYEQMDKASFALLVEAMGDLSDLFELRLNLRTEIGGTRTALGVVAYRNTFGSWPKPLTAIRPKFVKKLDVDPMDPDEEKNFRYFVPIRDFRRSERDVPGPYAVNVSIEPGAVKPAPMASDDDSLLSDNAPGASSAMLKAMSLLIVSGINDGKSMEEVWDELDSDQKQAMREDVEKMAKIFADHGVNRSNIEEFARNPPTDFVMGKRASDSPQAQEAIAAFFNGLFESNAFSGAVSTMQAGGELSEDQVMGAAAGVLATMMSMQGMPVPATLLEARNMGGSTDGIESSDEAPATEDEQQAKSFTVELDDSTFVLYSVGHDGKANWAKNVGQGGDDDLIWPPLLSLLREQ